MKAPNVTPGKWQLGNENNDCAEVLFGEEHNLVASFDRIDGNTGEVVISREEMLANVRMCIASKQLAEALHHLVRGGCRDTCNSRLIPGAACSCGIVDATNSLIAAGYREE